MFTLSASAPLPSSFSIYYAYPAMTQAIGILTFVPQAPMPTGGASRAFLSSDGWASYYSTTAPVSPPSFLISPAFSPDGSMSLVTSVPAYVGMPDAAGAPPVVLPFAKTAVNWTYVPLSNAYSPSVLSESGDWSKVGWSAGRLVRSPVVYDRAGLLVRDARGSTGAPFEVCNACGMLIAAALGSTKAVPGSPGVFTTSAWCGGLPPPVPGTSWTVQLETVSLVQGASIVPPAGMTVCSVAFDAAGVLVLQCAVTPGASWYLAGIDSGGLVLASTPVSTCAWIRDTSWSGDALDYMAVALAGTAAPWPLPSPLSSPPPLPTAVPVFARINNFAILQPDGQTYAQPIATTVGAPMDPSTSYCMASITIAGQTLPFISQTPTPPSDAPPVFAVFVPNVSAAPTTPFSITYTLLLGTQFAWTGARPVLTITYSGVYDYTPYALNAFNVARDASGAPWFTASMVSTAIANVPMFSLDLITSTISSLVADTTTAAFANVRSCAVPAVPFQLVNSNARAGALGPPGSTDALFNLTGLGTHMVVADGVHLTAVASTSDIAAATFTFQSATDAAGVLQPWFVLSSAAAGPLTVLAQGVASQYDDGRLTPQSMRVQVAETGMFVPSVASPTSALIAANPATAPRWAVALPNPQAPVPGPVLLLFQIGPYGQILALESGSMNFGSALNAECTGVARLWGGAPTVHRLWLPYGPLAVTAIQPDTAQVAVAVTPPTPPTSLADNTRGSIAAVMPRRHTNYHQRPAANMPRQLTAAPSETVAAAIWQNTGLLTTTGQQQLTIAKTQFWLYVTNANTVDGAMLANVCTATLAPLNIPWPSIALVQTTNILQQQTLQQQQFAQVARSSQTHTFNAASKATTKITPTLIIVCIVAALVVIVGVGTATSFMYQKRKQAANPKI